MKTMGEKLSEMDGFTDTEKELAGYIINHPDEISALSATELAERAFVSKASVSRMCKKLGAEG